MKVIRVMPSKLEGEIKAIASKSLSHRYIIAASMANGESMIKNILDSKDIEATKNVLINQGSNIVVKDDKTIVKGGSLKSLQTETFVNESGSTLRFFIPILWMNKEKSVLTATKGLINRPLLVYEDIAKKFNYHLEKKDNKITVAGPLRSGKYVLNGSISSQFITGLLYCLPLVNGNSKIIIKNKIASKDYINLTLDVLKESGIKIKKNYKKFIVKGNQEYEPINKEVEGDYSQIAFFIVGAMITKSKIKISNVNKKSRQGDKKILDIAMKQGVKITFDNDIMNIDGTKFKDKKMKIDLYDIPDLGPILMVMAATRNGVTTFKNINRLKIKESDRLLAMKNNLEPIGVEFRVIDNLLYLKGLNNIDASNTIFDSYNDHRIVMALSILGLHTKNGVRINDYEVVNKSYPNFFDDLSKLGGKVFYD